MIILSKPKQQGEFFMKDCNCGYCMGGEILAGFGIKICAFPS